MRIGLILSGLALTLAVKAQKIQWQNVDSLFGPLPASVHVYQTTTPLEKGKANLAYYVIADLKDPALSFATDTTEGRRLTPAGFYAKNQQPVVVVNGTFFSFETNRNLNLVIKDGKVVAHNIGSVYDKRDEVYYYVTRSAIGIDKEGNADVAWIYSDSAKAQAYAVQFPANRWGKTPAQSVKDIAAKNDIQKWSMQTAIAGGPSLIRDGHIAITNEQERMFRGKQIEDKHPRTAMGYTADGKLIILVVQGRMPGIADGASLAEEARILKELGCYEALNMDGGGSSCLLVNGKETIKPSDKEGQRPVPAVFMIQRKQ